MQGIAQATRYAIRKDPFLQEALSRNILNYQAAAETITPFIEKQLNKKVKTTTVMITLRRIAAKQNKQANKQTRKQTIPMPVLRSPISACSLPTEKAASFFSKILQKAGKDFCTSVSDKDTATCFYPSYLDKELTQEKNKEVIKTKGAILEFEKKEQVDAFFILQACHDLHCIPLRVIETKQTIALYVSEEDALTLYAHFKEVTSHE